MDIIDETEVLRKLRKQRHEPDDDLEMTEEEFLKEAFEDPKHSDVLLEKQVKEGKRKK